MINLNGNEVPDNWDSIPLDEDVTVTYEDGNGGITSKRKNFIVTTDKYGWEYIRIKPVPHPSDNDSFLNQPYPMERYEVWCY